MKVEVLFLSVLLAFAQTAAKIKDKTEGSKFEKKAMLSRSERESPEHQEPNLKVLDDDWTEFWAVRLAVNLLGYATIFVPGYLIIRHLRRTRYNESAGKAKALSTMN